MTNTEQVVIERHDATLLRGVAPAGARRPAAFALDVIAAASTLTLGWLVSPALGVLLCLTVLAMNGIDLARHGRTLGQRVLHLRTVDPTTALPGGPRTLLPAQGVTADLTRGRDPLQLEPSQARSPARSMPKTDPDPWTGRSPTARASVPSLTLEDGVIVPVLQTMIIGRNPADPSHRHTVLAVPDLSRTMSRNHALVEPDGVVLWVTDLGSGNGTTILHPNGSVEKVAPGQRSPALAGAHLTLGERRIGVTAHQVEGAP